jgi:16S rRNA processing protein RimM
MIVGRVRKAHGIRGDVVIAADAWHDRFILAPADELEPLGEHEVYVHDLIGMRVELSSGEHVGEVLEVFELPQGLALEVRRAKGTVLVPYDRVVTEVRRDERLIRIDPPAGLLDD